MFTKHPHLVNTSNGNYELNLGFKNSFTPVQFNVAGCPRSHLPRVSPHLFHHPTHQNVADGRHPTPLHFAAAASAVRTVQWLLDHGANPNVRNANGELPADVAGSA